MPLPDIKQYTSLDNIAAELDEDQLNKIASKLIDQIEKDDQSRSKWLEDNDKWLELAQQVTEPKSYPWPNAANVKFPLLSTASIQFHARAYPALLGSRDIAKCRIIGKTDDKRRARADRVGRFISTQVIDLMDGWSEEMDRLLFILPIVGLAYKKTYYSGLRETIKSELVSARDVIINYHANDYSRARITHRIWQDQNEILEYINSDLYLDVDLNPPEDSMVPGTRDIAQGFTPIADDELSPFEIYESHCWLDLDEDGYKEPYIVTIVKNLSKVVRIVARWEDWGIKTRGNKITRIEPIEYFTAYRFLPDPDSKVYALGFGKLLGPTNEAVNSLINLLIDSGHLATLQGGFLSRGVRVKGGSVRFKPGEWLQVQSTGDDLRNGIFPLPVKEPSSTLFQLLGLLINSGKDLSTVQDINVGRNPGQNQPFATTQEVIQQGEKVFNGIYKRVYSALSNELQKIYLLNRTHLRDIDYINILDIDLQNPAEAEASVQNDFELESMDMVPSAEPDLIMETQKIQRANALAAKAAQGLPVNVQVVTRRLLEAEGHENIEELMTMPPPQPSLEEQELQLEREKFEHQKMVDQANIQILAHKTENQALRDKLAAIAGIKKVEIEEKRVEAEIDRDALDHIHKDRDEGIRIMEKQVEATLKEMDINSKERQAELKVKSANTRKSGD